MRLYLDSDIYGELVDNQPLLLERMLLLTASNSIRVCVGMSNLEEAVLITSSKKRRRVLDAMGGLGHYQLLISFMDMIGMWILWGRPSLLNESVFLPKRLTNRAWAKAYLWPKKASDYVQEYKDAEALMINDVRDRLRNDPHLLTQITTTGPVTDNRERIFEITRDFTNRLYSTADDIRVFLRHALPRFKNTWTDDQLLSLLDNPWFRVFAGHSAWGSIRATVDRKDPQNLLNDKYDRLHLAHASAADHFITNDGILRDFIVYMREKDQEPSVMGLPGLHALLAGLPPQNDNPQLSRRSIS